MRKYITLLLSVLLLVGVTACGEDTRKPDKDTPATTVTPQPIASGDTDPTDGTTVTTTTNNWPTGVTVPIGTKPTGTTTQTIVGTTTQTPSVGDTTVTTTDTTATATQPTTPPSPELYIVLPAVGTDIDVVNNKNRIHISAAIAWLNEDGTIGVQLTFKNSSANWITEETDYVEYTCYDKHGNVLLQNERIMIGSIDTKTNKEKSYTFDVSADTAEVKLTNSKIVYWTEWA